MYFGGTIMTFALPYGAFIVVSLALFFLFRGRHAGPRLKYMETSGVTSLTTREPGPAPAPSVAAAEAQPKAEAEPKADTKSAAEPETATVAETTESKEGEE
jgi:hypothetical protein